MGNSGKETESLIKAVFFDLGDTLIVEEAVGEDICGSGTGGETIEELLLKTVGRKNNNTQARCQT